jgi:hypothetical protein
VIVPGSFTSTPVEIRVVSYTATATSNAPLFAGQTLNLTATPSQTGGTYSWSGPGAFSSTRRNPNITSATPAASGIYTVAITDGYGCSDTTTTNTLVNATPVPTVTPTGAAQVCPGGTLTMTTVSSHTLLWYSVDNLDNNEWTDGDYWTKPFTVEATDCGVIVWFVPLIGILLAFWIVMRFMNGTLTVKELVGMAVAGIIAIVILGNFLVPFCGLP